MTDKKIEAIRSILRKRDPTLLSNFHLDGDLSALDEAQRQKIVEHLLEELSEFGLDSKSEPNQYGHELEELIDECNKKLLCRVKV